MIDQSGPESHGVILVLPELSLAGEMLRKLRGLMGPGEGTRKRAESPAAAGLCPPGAPRSVRAEQAGAGCELLQLPTQRSRASHRGEGVVAGDTDDPGIAFRMPNYHPPGK